MIYFVSTPIGNLKDITLRALEILKSVDVIACEDTRTSMKLLNHYDIHTKLISYHKFNERDSSEGIIKLAGENKDIAIISDAGTPAVSDPGYILIEKLLEHNIAYTVVPGASAILPALILSGINSSSFSFLGFIPEKNTLRKKLLEEISTYQTSLIFYISPHKLLSDINYIYSFLGKRKAALVKEITKLNETSVLFTLGETLDIVPKGEYVLVVEGFHECEEKILINLSVFEHYNFYINLGHNKNSAIKLVAKDRKVKKDEIYKEILKL